MFLELMFTLYIYMSRRLKMNIISVALSCLLYVHEFCSIYLQSFGKLGGILFAVVHCLIRNECTNCLILTPNP